MPADGDSGDCSEAGLDQVGAVRVRGTLYRGRRANRTMGERASRPGLPILVTGQQSAQFGVGEIAPLAGLQMAELDIADAHAHQLLHAVTEMRRHQADLPVQALRQHDAEPDRADLEVLQGRVISPWIGTPRLMPRRNSLVMP